ncbi:unnamed protein product [Camellia sinensis]
MSSKKAEKRIRKECEAIIAATMEERRNASFRILDECSTSPHVESHDMEGVVDSTQVPKKKTRGASKREDPIAKRSLASPQRNVFENKDVAMANDALQTVVKESGMKESAVSELQKSQAAEAVRDHWRKSTPQSIQLKELSPQLRDYECLIARHHMEHSNIALVHYREVK